MNKKWVKTGHLAGLSLLITIYVMLEFMQTGSDSEGTRLTPRTTHSTSPVVENMRSIVAFSSLYQAASQLNEKVLCESASASASNSNTPTPTPPTDLQTQPHLPPSVSSSQTWTFDTQLGIALLSAYHDNREEPYHYVRIIALLPTNATFHCQLRYKRPESIIAGKARVDRIWSDQWGHNSNTSSTSSTSSTVLFPSLVSCLIPPDVQPPRDISLSNSSCVMPTTKLVVSTVTMGAPGQEHKPGTSETLGRKQFVVCVKPLVVTGAASTQVDQWLRLLSLLGASRVVTYSSLPPDPHLLRVLQPYVTSDLLHMVTTSHPDWSVLAGPGAPSDIWHKRKIEIALYNDCLYRNLYTTQYIIPLDVDEVIVPKIGRNWLEMFKAHFGALPERTGQSRRTEYSSYSVRNVYFFSRYPPHAVVVSGKPIRKHQVSSSNPFSRSVRSYHFSPGVDSAKSFIHVANTLTVFHHFAFHTLNHARRQYIMPRGVAQLNHYRSVCDSSLIDGCANFLNYITHDESLSKLMSKLL